ncbi:MAG: hypothetical protein IT244_08105 [Bacteroidia bacterium]|nr:hypothetical protein [Bacteroidia bacterium]
MIKRILFLLVFVCVFIPKSWGYTDKPVLVNVNIGRQSDTMGFNIAHELVEFFYNMIQDKKTVLWDSPKKSFQVSPESLAAIENSSGTKFREAKDLFLHEYWSSTRRKTVFTIVGITFINEGKKGKVTYGYIDLSDCWKYVEAFRINCNVNGPAELSLPNALYSRNYNFNVVQFGKRAFSTHPEDAIKVRDKAFYSNKFIEGLYIIPKTKDITYVIEPDMNDAKEIGHVFFTNIQDYLNNNKEVLFNIGGDKYFDYKTFRSELAVTRIEINEVWTKKESYVDYTVKNIVIYVNNKKLDPISLEVLLGWDMLYNFKTAEDVLKEKKFKFTLIKLNNTFVPEEDSPKFLKSLEKYSWTQVSRYVKFY